MLVREHVHLIAVEDARPRDRAAHRPNAGAAVPAIGASHVGHARVSFEVDPVAGGQPRNPAAGIDDEVPIDLGAVHNDAGHPAVALDDALDMADRDGEHVDVRGGTA